MLKILLTTLLITGFFIASAQQTALSGHITDQNGHPVPFASVYVQGSTYGTTANENGDYFFKLKSGNCDIVYRFVGYRLVTKHEHINGSDQRQDVQMTEDPYKLIPGKVNGSQKYDPAAEIMRKVVTNRKYHLREIKDYSCTVYIKGVKTITDTPKTLLGKGMQKLLKLDTGSRGISYQSESISSYSFEQKHKVKEVFVASKISGTDPPFGYNKASDLQVNFYEDLFIVEGLNSHGFVSPLAKYAWAYYKYKLLGSVVEDGKTIDKIQVIPRRRSVRSFHGSIYIIEGDWRIYSVDLFLTKKENNLNFIDTLKVSQQYIPVKNTWAPIAFQYRYQADVYGLKYKGYYLGIYNHYKIDTPFEKDYFNGEVLHVDTAAKTRTASFWAENRQVPLTQPEIYNFHRSDSLFKIAQTQKYRDSIQHNNNTFSILPFLLDGYTASYKDYKDTVFVYPLAQSVYYNTVEGWGFYLRGTYTKTFEDNRSFSITPGVRYGFSDKLFNANIHTSYTYDQANAGRIFFDIGDDLLDLNSLGTRSLYFNTLSTLLSEQNFVKYYRSKFVDAGYQRELTRGILWTANLSYAQRTQLYNTSDQHIFTAKGLAYISNNPLAPITAPVYDHSILFPQNDAMILNTSLRFTFDQEYITEPSGRVYLPSLYPVITIDYRKGINNVFNSTANFDFLGVDVRDDRIPMGLFGHSAFVIRAGGFLNKQALYYTDYNHFYGNEGTTSDPTYVGVFHFLPFYTFSTSEPFLEVHYQHNFAGAILDNVPLLRNFKLEEVVGANYLTYSSHPNYSEFYFGLKRLSYGADYGVSYLGNRRYLKGFRIFIGLK
ncbi:MAG TPA: DUF5686 family protein [Mucilaginibacter sp.]|jgi:hypothetical protein|nr:DUF5686 family protein [Mucilaginibacter sp.]